jgi:hypothetical protein
LRYLWQRIEVYDGMETGKGLLEPRYMCTRTPARIKIKMYAEELVRQLEVVTVREPNLARHVKSVKLTHNHLCNFCSDPNFPFLIVLSTSL